MTKMITGAAIGFFRLKVLISACKLEGQGLKSRGPSALSTLKRELGLKGSRATVMENAQKMHDDLIASWQK
jgi:hypothetical protein